MSGTILDRVLEQLREADFTAVAAYPGQKFSGISGIMAAVQIQEASPADGTVTVKVDILSPASMGGAACQLAALRAGEALYQAGGECVQKACSFDGGARMYTVPILAAFACIPGEDSLTIGQGFQVYAGGVLLPYALSFQAEQKLDHGVQFAMGETAPVGVSLGSWYWAITLEEQIPPGLPETAHPAESFTLRVVSDTAAESYAQCRWTNVRREFTRQGLRRVCTGIALLREEG